MGQLGNSDLHVTMMESPLYLPRLLSILYMMFGLADSLGVPMGGNWKKESQN